MSTSPPTPEHGFDSDVDFMMRHTNSLVLSRGDAKVLVTPEYQGRVMTSTTGTPRNPSFGWINYPLVETGVLEGEAAEGRLEKHIHVFGGEERFWLGPEGGQFAIYFAPGAKFVFDDWKTPAVIDTEPFAVTDTGTSHATFRKEFELTNYSGTRFSARVERRVDVLADREIADTVGDALPDGVTAVAYRTTNRLTNTGSEAWTRDGGTLSIWLLGMYKPSAETTVVIPFRSGDEATLGPKVNDAYFGKVPADRLVVRDDVLFFKADGEMRGKIGLSSQRATGICGSFDGRDGVLTVVVYDMPEGEASYVNSMWELQDDPFGGDVINAYNDGPPEPGKPPLGPFYELETSSPAAFLAPDETLTHRQTTIHFEGPRRALDGLSKRLLGVGLDEIEGVW